MHLIWFITWYNKKKCVVKVHSLCVKIFFVLFLYKTNFVSFYKKYEETVLWTSDFSCIFLSCRLTNLIQISTNQLETGANHCQKLLTKTSYFSKRLEVRNIWYSAAAQNNVKLKLLFNVETNM